MVIDKIIITLPQDKSGSRLYYSKLKLYMLLKDREAK